MGLLHDDLAKLRGRFAANEHEFLRGFAYITEGAITNRIEEVDPSWTFELLNSHIRDNQAVVVGRLTIKGVSRDGVGMQLVNEKAGEPEKGAATDSLKRCARLFGIGRYLLDLPDTVKDMASLRTFLNTPPAGNTGGSSRFTGSQGSTPTTPQNATPIVFTAISARAGKDTVGTYLELIDANGGFAVTREKDVLKSAGYPPLIKELDKAYALSPAARVTGVHEDGHLIAKEVVMEF